jgi:hypothetical protein
MFPRKQTWPQLTLWVRARRSISNVVGVRVTQALALVTPAFTAVGEAVDLCGVE